MLRRVLVRITYPSGAFYDVVAYESTAKLQGIPWTQYAENFVDYMKEVFDHCHITTVTIGGAKHDTSGTN